MQAGPTVDDWGENECNRDEDEDWMVENIEGGMKKFRGMRKKGADFEYEKDAVRKD